MNKPLGFAFATLALCLCACDSSTSSNSGSSSASVDAAVIGTWKGVAGVSAGDTLTINKDSLSLTSEYGGMGIGPNKFGGRFYAQDGKMGTTTGQGTPGVAYEYLISGDTLWMEFQNLAVAPVDGVVDRTKSTAFLKIK
jgi:hypothetical protein